MITMPFRKNNSDIGSVNLWVVFAVPVLVTLFMFLFLDITLSYNYKRYVQNVGDLAAEAAVLEIDETTLFYPPPGETEPIILLDTDDASNIADTYLYDNLITEQNYIKTPIQELLGDSSTRSLILDQNNRPISSDEIGIAIVILSPDIGYNPINDTVVSTSSILVVIQIPINSLEGPRMITTYSIATL
jgi:hypothetical protein